MIKHLSTIEEVIAELGGFDAVKELTNAQAPSVVPMWKHRKKFPAVTFTTIQTALQQRGMSAPNSLWGMP